MNILPLNNDGTTIIKRGGGGGSSVTVDAAMSATSTNPVQNKVVKEYIDAQVGNINTILETIIAG